MRSADMELVIVGIRLPLVQAASTDQFIVGADRRAGGGHGAGIAQCPGHAELRDHDMPCTAQRALSPALLKLVNDGLRFALDL